MGAAESVLPYVGTEEVSGKANLMNTLKACAAEIIGTLFLVRLATINRLIKNIKHFFSLGN